jgi:Fe-S cluster assembly scaffold protein SufB
VTAQSKKRRPQPQTLRISKANASDVVLIPAEIERVVVQPGTTAIIVDRISGVRRRKLEIAIGSRASVHVISFVRKFSGSIVYRSDVAASARVCWHIVSVDCSRAAFDLISKLDGKDAISSIDWVFRTRGKESMAIDVRNVFAAPHGRGEIVMKGIAEDESRCRATGMIEIGEEGRGTATHLTEDVLMLDASAKVDAVPALEIRTNDVKASHSATVSKVSPEQMFYLESRGLPAPEARRMFVEGFLGELIAKIPDPKIREEVGNALDEK